MLSDVQILENVRLAAGCGATPTMLLTVALASMTEPTIDGALDHLDRLRSDIVRLHQDTPRPHAELAKLEPELVEDPPPARMRLDIADHELRGRLLFKELLGQKSFVQVAALAIANLELSDSDAELLDDEGVLTQLADPRIWPLTVARRIAAGGGSLAESVVAGLASLCTEQMTVLPVAGFMRFLDRLDSRVREGQALDDAVCDLLARGERIPGVGRPVFKRDERVPPKLALARLHRRDSGPSMKLALELDRTLEAKKGLRVNSAGFQAALLRDMGFSPDTAAAFCLIYFLVPVLMHAVAQQREALNPSPRDSGSARCSTRASDRL